MPTLLDTPARTEVLLAAINSLLVDHGPAGLTMRQIGRRSGLSPSTILHHLDTRQRLLRVTGGLFVHQYVRQLSGSCHEDGPLALIPRHDHEVIDARAWLSWQEVWRSEPGQEASHIEASREMHSLVVLVTRRSPDDAQTLGLLALVDGLRAAMCAPVDPLRPREAREILARHLRVPATPIPVANPERGATATSEWWGWSWWGPMARSS